MKIVCFIGIQECFGFDQCFLDFGEGFVNTWFHFPWHSSVCKICWDFVAPHLKEANTLCFIEIQELFSSEQWFLDFGEVSSTLNFTCLEAVLHVNYAQTLFQHQSTKPETCVSSTSKHYLAPISVFWTLVSVFLNTWFHLTWRTSVYKSCEDFVLPHIKKARTLCFIGIQHLFTSEQWFLDLVSVFVSTSFHLSRRSSVCKSLSTLFYHMLWKRKNFVSLCIRGSRTKWRGAGIEHGAQISSFLGSSY